MSKIKLHTKPSLSAYVYSTPPPFVVELGDSKDLPFLFQCSVTICGDFTPNWLFSKSFGSRINPIGAWRKGCGISNFQMLPWRRVEFGGFFFFSSVRLSVGCVTAGRKGVSVSIQEKWVLCLLSHIQLSFENGVKQIFLIQCNKY